MHSDDPSLRYCEGHVAHNTHDAWLESGDSIYEVTVPAISEVRNYKNGVPQPWKKQRTKTKAEDYVAAFDLPPEN